MVDLAMCQLTIHFFYSLYRYYGSKYPYITRWLTYLFDWENKGLKRYKVISVVFAHSCLILLYCWKFEACSFFKNWRNVGNLVLVCGTLHFFFMEINRHWVMGCRPYGFLPLLFFALAMYELNNGHKYVKKLRKVMGF